MNRHAAATGRRLRAIVRAGVALACLLAFGSCASRPDSIPSELDFTGNVWPSGLRSDPAFADYWDQLTPENAGKWGSVEAIRDRMAWEDLDAAYNAAQELGIPFRYHTLVWGQQQPAWIGDLEPTEQRREVEEWIALVAKRYPNVDFIDVVNEPLHARPVYAEALGGYGDTRWDWVVTAFELARNAFPDAALQLNDYNILRDGTATTRYLDLIEALQERGLIDAIGVQGHSLERVPVAVLAANLDRLAETGLPVYVTELDVAVRDDLSQARRVRELYELFAAHPAVRGVTFWGYREGMIWREDAYLLRADGTPRPALEWLACVQRGGRCRLPE